MIEQRNIRNSQFDNQLEKFDSESDFNAVPEEGAIIYADGRAYYGNGEEFIELANSYDIPTFENGYYRVEDTRYTSAGNSQTLTASENRIANNAGSVTGELAVYDEPSNAFILRSRAIYTISISFTARVSANNQHAQIFLGGSGLAWNGLSTIVTFPKGNNVDHEFYLTFQVVGDRTTESTGIIPYIFPSHAGNLWNTKFTIQRAF
jgi:hypothetical protein